MRKAKDLQILAKEMETPSQPQPAEEVPAASTVQTAPAAEPKSSGPATKRKNSANDDDEVSPSQPNTSLAETPIVNLLRTHPSDTIIDGTFIADNYEALKRFMALKNSIDHLGLQITRCTKGNEVTIATQIANQKTEMQAICTHLNVLYGKLPPNQQALDELLAAHLEKLNADQEKAAAAANSKPPPQGISQQKRKTSMTIDDEGFITPGRRRTKKGSTTATPNPAPVNINTNRFSIPTNSHPEVADEGNREQFARRPRIPPFFVKTRPDWHSMLTLIRQEAPSMTAVMSRDHFSKLQCRPIKST
ncbi:hypothetical protein CEXT_354721 [Caerostris extrusa]|uniref:Uncharacterized protein n=1 Tax=Caerostris extrusa TaxID=172846 RepID=A0AAV4XJB9_CAEEX|nr:hypothetical protein CEXT_354721 [Caerostris extrusa]